MTLSRRASRRTAFFLLYQWDVTGQPLASLYEGEVDGGSATVTLRLAARSGTLLPQLAEEVQGHVASALEQMCGVEVRSVDLAIEELV